METPKQNADEFEREYKLSGLFIENAKTYVQLSTGALVLTVTFLHDILGVPKDQKVPTDVWLVLSWISFLVAILSGAYYQYLETKFVEWKSAVVRHHETWPKSLIEHPWPVYDVMLVTFYLGTICFTVAAIRRPCSG